MPEALTTLDELLALDTVRSGGRALLILICGIALARFLGRRLPVAQLHPQYQLLLRHVVKYSLTLFTLAWAVRELGVSLELLLGTAGILTVALGFAAQTSASNLISGFFLMAERPFLIGDVISVAGTTGEVVTIELLSVRIRTFDNLLVRIPNEAVLKSNVTNLSFYPIRRVDLRIPVRYQSNLERVADVLRRVAEENPICLVEPAPLVLFQEFGDASVVLQFSVWGTRGNYVELRNQMSAAVPIALGAAGIEMPIPERILVPPSASAKPET